LRGERAAVVEFCLRPNQELVGEAVGGAPDLLGGGKTVMLGNLVQNQFTTARDWPFGSAVSLVLMAIVMLLLFVIARGEREDLL